MVERVRQQCVLEEIETTLERKVQKNRKPRTLDGKGETKLVMLACSNPPDGHAQWSLKLLSNKLVELEIVDTISTETVRRSLIKLLKAVA
ncbi:MAG: helix-turn-helix domain-containing protein [Rhodobacteraceae bacterium]|nr:helix-turn-helix domain-containing protein [Paracoccaceae bacterium]